MLNVLSYCDQCATCVAVCPSQALHMGEFQVRVNQDLCSQCGICVKLCPLGALELKDDE